MNKHQKDWDSRIQFNYRLWMSDGLSSDEEMFRTGERDLALLLPPSPADKHKFFLEIGCGVGRLLKAASKRFSKVVGVDISQVAINKAKSLLKNLSNVTLYLTDGVSLPPDLRGQGDIVASFATMFSIPVSSFANYIIEANRFLKTGGELAWQLFLGEEIIPPEDDSLSIRSYREDRLEKAFSLANFEIFEVKELKDYPIETNLKFLKTKAHIVRAVKKSEVTISLEELLNTLFSGTYSSNSEKFYELSMYYEYVKFLISSRSFGELDRYIQKVTELAKSLNAIEIIEEIQKLKDFLPVTSIIEEHKQELDFRPALNNIPVPFYKGQPLSNCIDPKKFEEKLIPGSSLEKPVIVFGTGAGFLIQELAKKTDQIYCIEPIEELRAIYKNLPVKFLNPESIDEFSDFELIINPSYLSVFPEISIKLKQANARKYLNKNYTVAVVSPIDGGSYPISKYLVSALKHFGYRVLFFDFSDFYHVREAVNKYYLHDFSKNQYTNSVVELCSQALLNGCRTERPQIVFALSQAPITPVTLKALRDEGIITCMWFVEDFRRFTYWKEVAPYYDYFYVIQKKAVSEISKLCPNVFYVPVGCDPSVHKPVQLTEEERLKYSSDVSFIGYGYPNRVQTFSRLTRYNLKIWGKMWPKTKPFSRIATEVYLQPEEYIKIFSASKINLNLHSSSEKDFIEPFGDFVNPRTFEIASCRAFQLCDKRLHLSELFGDTIQTFETLSELKDKIEYFLARPDERFEMANKSFEVATKKHTYIHRAEEMMLNIIATSDDKLSSSLKKCKWNQTLESLSDFPTCANIFLQAFKHGVPWDFDQICSSTLIGKKGSYSEDELKMLVLYHCNRNSKRFIKYA